MYWYRIGSPKCRMQDATENLPPNKRAWVSSRVFKSIFHPCSTFQRQELLYNRWKYKNLRITFPVKVSLEIGIAV